MSPSYASTRPFLLACCLVGVLGSSVGGQEWTRFRGPNGSGVTPAAVPVEWKEGDYDWKVQVPGEGHSQPVIWGDRIFLTSSVEEGRSRIILCLRAGDGGTEWTRSHELSPFSRNPRNSHASATPAVDGERAYVVFASPERYLLEALDHTGKEVWHLDLGPHRSQHGDGASPIVHDGVVYFANEQDGPSFVVALDARTGALRWKRERRTVEAAYGTPCVYEEPGGRPALLLSSHAHGLSSLDLVTGNLNWEATVFDKRTVSSPILGGGLAIGTCGSGGGGNFLVAVRIGGKGEVTSTHVAYKLTHAIPYVPTSIVKGGEVFLWQEKGIASCIDLKTGDTVWQERIGGSYFGSPICAADRLYCMSEGGEVVVLDASRTFRVLARNPLGEGSRSTPAVSGGRLYLRTYRHLLSVGGSLRNR